MNPKIKKFFDKHDIQKEDIKYIIREDGKTAIHLDSGRVITTYRTIKDFQESLPTEDFFCPNKGVLVAGAYIVDVSNGAYTMNDGRSFKYRVHNSQLHDIRLLTLGRNMEHIRNEIQSPHFSVLDKMPLGVCILQRVGSEPGSLGSFLCRYCNEELLRFEGWESEDAVGHDVQEFFPDLDINALIAFADVALNGTARIVKFCDTKRNILAKLYCYQPIPDHCACIMTDYNELNATEKEHPYCKVTLIGQ